MATDSTSQAGGTGGDALVGSLADSGVTHVFANPGTSELDLVVALDREPRIQSVPVVFENVASGAADGFARMAARPAATLLHLGPGYLNAAANLHNARRARSPIVNIVGDHAVSHRALDAPLTSDIKAIVAPHSAWVRDVTTAAEMGAAAAEAVRVSVAQRGQSTLIVAADAAWSRGGERAPVAPAPPPLAPEQRVIQAAIEALRSARNPAILVGGTVLNETGLAACARLAGAGFRILSETFPARHARGQGRFTPERLAYFAEMGVAQLAGVDLLLLVGAKDPVGFFAYADKPARHLPEGCVARSLASPGEDEGLAIQALADAVGAAPAAATAEIIRPNTPTGAITPAALAAAVARNLPANAIVSDDGVTASGPVSMMTAQGPAHDWLCLTGGALGQGLPLAIGAALAAPNRTVICLTGDGAMLYTMQALWTIARLGLNIITVVAVNRSYEILKIELARMGVNETGAASRDLLDLSNPSISYTQLAQGFGIEGRRCETAESLDHALHGAFGARTPILIEAILHA